VTEVKCKVKSCQYWGNGDICVADSIMVDNHRLGSSISRMEVGDLNLNTRRSRQERDSSAQNLSSRASNGNQNRASQFGDYEIGDLNAQSSDLLKQNAGSGDQASTSEETVCRTFRPKGTPPRN
jgi:hypothetical protein